MDYTHQEWLSSLPASVQLLEGDGRAIAAIQAETRAHYGVSDITDDAPVFLWNGTWVKGFADQSYEVPDHVRSKYLQIRSFPQNPIAVWPAEPTLQDDSRRADLIEKSAPAEGDPLGIAEAIEVTRLYHEMPKGLFPANGELRWFSNGLHVIGPGEDPSVFQTPMDRLAEIVVPRSHPHLPWLKAPRPIK